MKGKELTLKEVLLSQGKKVVVDSGEEQVFIVGERYFIDDIGIFRILDGHENQRKYYEYVE